MLGSPTKPLAAIENLQFRSRSKCPITAVHLYGGLVLFAEGGTLHVCSHENLYAKVSSYPIFQHQQIHGITSVRVSERCFVVLLWGGRSFRFMTIISPEWEVIDRRGPFPEGEDAVDETCIDLHIEACAGSTVYLPDRILHGDFRPGEQNTASSSVVEAVLVTAHSALHRGTFSHSSCTTSQPRILRPATRSLLFTAQIRWLSFDSLLFCAGTAFGELIVELISFKVHNAHIVSQRRQAIDAAHDGAIFGLDSLLSESEAGLDKVLIATCSDDRKIKLWDPGFSVGLGDGGHRLDTGELELLGWTWAHDSRIWAVSFAVDALNSFTSWQQGVLLSFGEDATAQAWHFSLATNIQTAKSCRASFQHVSTLTAHAGKNIWASAVSPCSSRDIRVVTGGADGAIELSNLRLPSCPDNSGGEIGLNLRHLSVEHRPSKVRNFCWLNASSLLATEQSGGVWLLNISLQGTPASEWHLVENVKSIGGYSVLCNLAHLPGALIGASDGTVVCFRCEDMSIQPVLQVEGKVIGILTPGSKTSVAPLAFLVSTLSCAQATLCFSSNLSTKSQHITLSLVSPSPVTSFELASTDPHYYAVFIGHRDGQISIYSIDVIQSPAGVVYTPVISTRPHADAVTSIAFLSTPAASPGHHHLLTTSRDSSYAIYAIKLQDSPPTLTEIHRGHPPLGPFIEGAVLRSDHHLLLHGFRGNDFVVYDATSRRELARVNCKGGHRVWSYCPAREQPHKAIGSFAWNTGGNLRVVELKAADRTTLRTGGHGREIKACAVHPVSSRSGCLIATGAEDTDVRLFSYAPHATDPQFECVAVIRKHNTGIQSLRWSSDGQRLFSAGGSEEFFVWRITPHAPVVGVGVVCEAKLPRLEEGTPDLRITDFDVEERSPPTADDDETTTTTCIIIRMTLSDSTIRTYTYTPHPTTTPNFTLNHRAHHPGSSSSLTCIRHLPSTNPPLTLVGATNGHLLAFTAAAPPFLSPTPHWTHPVHQNAIKALLPIPLPPSQDAALIVTAGDDNALAFTLITLNTTVSKMSVLRVARAHAASITSLALIRDPFLPPCRAQEREEDIVVIASTGNDQWVRTWRVRLPCGFPEGAPEGSQISNVETMEVHRAGRRFTQVADGADMVTIGGGVLVVGVGMEVVILGEA